MHLRDLDGFEAELEEGRRQIAARRQVVLDATGRAVRPTRMQWLRRQVRSRVHRHRYVEAMTENVNAQAASDAQLLLTYMDAEGLDGAVQAHRGMSHIGGLIVDSALQRQLRYASVVAPRVAKFIEAWPDANTTTGFQKRLSTDDLGQAVDWSGADRLDQMIDTATLFAAQGIETVADLRDRLSGGSERTELRRALSGIHNVGPKTLDYFDILSGDPESAAIDSRIRKAASAAGINELGYDHLHEVLAEAATLRGWRLGDLDAVLWAAHDD